MKERSTRRVARVAGLVFVLGLLGTTAGVLAVRAEAVESRRNALELSAQRVRTAIEQQVRSYAETLFGLRSLFATDRPLTREGFSTYLTLLDPEGRLPGSRAISFDRRVRARDRDAYERAIRSSAPKGTAYEGFTIRPDRTPGDLYVVEFIIPVEGNEKVIGFNIASDPVRFRAIREARDTGELAATEPVALLQGGRGFLLALAVYSRADVPVTAPARRRHVEGVMVAVFETSRIFDLVFSRFEDVNVAVYDVGRTTEPQRPTVARGEFVGSTTGRAPDDGSLSNEQRVLDLYVGNRRWRMLVAPSDRFPVSSVALVPWMVAGGGSLLSALLAALVLSFMRSRARALQLAADMTVSLRESEARLQTANERLELRNRQLRDFVAVTSHDLRSPIASLRVTTDLLQLHWEETPDKEKRELIDLVGRQADQMNRLVEDLLIISALDAGGIPVRHVDVAVRGVVASALDQLGPAAEGIEVAVDDDLVVRADEDHVLRMLVNLLSNAIKYGDRPITVAARAESGAVEIRVGDAGGGVPEGFVDRLFERFARAPGASSRAKGTGLGLSIVRGLARANGGDAWYEPGHRSGACFAIRLPSAPAA